MERSEPTLVPQWLRSTGSVTGAGNSAHLFASSSSHSDVSLAPHTRSRTSKSNGEFEGPRSTFLDRSSSSNSRRNSSNGSAKHAYSSFNRSHRDRDRDKERDRDRYGDPWDRDYSDPLGSIFSRVEKDTLRRSQSMVSRKQGDPLTRRGSTDLKNSSGSGNHNNGNGLVSGITKAVFEKDFPSLGADEKQSGLDVARVPSPGFTSAVQSLPVVNSALVGGEGWTSALAEVPSIIGSSSSASLSAQQSTVAASGPSAPTAMAGLNMAEALAQAPSRARAAPQLSVKTQRLEELAIKQSRQLIPVTPSMPKASALSSEKSKPKASARTSEMSMGTKSGQQQPSLQNVNQYLRSGSIKPETPKTSSHGKFLVLKPGWENGVSHSSSKDVTSPTNSSSGRAASGQLLAATAAPPAMSAPVRSPNGHRISSVERKVSALDLKSGSSTMEKRPSLSQVQSRNDFFNLIKKKTSGNASTVLLPDSTSPTVSSPTHESSSGEVNTEVFGAPTTSPCAVENGSPANGNGEVSKEGHNSPTDAGEDGYLDEEEAKFLRSLGWDENAGEDEGLTEEEINAFYEECMKKKTLQKLSRGIQPKLSMVSESQATNTGGGSSELSSSDSGSDA